MEKLLSDCKQKPKVNQYIISVLYLNSFGCICERSFIGKVRSIFHNSVCLPISEMYKVYTNFKDFLKSNQILPYRYLFPLLHLFGNFGHIEHFQHLKDYTFSFKFLYQNFCKKHLFSFQDKISVYTFMASISRQLCFSMLKKCYV